ncbi:CdaR family transcriptional regulator [Salipaludibacillus sp. HK11]|uniref:CdaR family transcriptional regulator n=1 Tax=Salipaludibacillus sp. HK11 TaxID=3394320 RepID=UPI0039FCD636
MIRASLANNVIQEVRKLLDEDLIVVDNNGIIIASTDNRRINTFHEGALISHKKGSKIIITEEDQETLKGVRAGINLPIFFQEQIVAILGITGDPEKISSYGELVRKMTELLIKESYYSEQLEVQSRALEAFVFDWVQQKEWSPSFINQAELLAVDLSVRRQVIIGRFVRNSDTFFQRDAWSDVIKTILHDSKDIFVRWGNERFVLLRAYKEKETKQSLLLFIQQLQNYLQDKYNQRFSFGIGQAVSPHHLNQSFENAERALAVAMRNQSIVFDEDLRLEMCLQDISLKTRKDFVHRTIASILDDSDLMKTIKSFIAHDQSFKETAKALPIHINTLHYRLKKIEKLTELNPRSFHDMTTLYLALLFLDD